MVAVAVLVARWYVSLWEICLQTLEPAVRLRAAHFFVLTLTPGKKTFSAQTQSRI
jgi:hypothetical protein